MKLVSVEVSLMTCLHFVLLRCRLVLFRSCQCLSPLTSFEAPLDSIPVALGIANKTPHAAIHSLVNMYNLRCCKGLGLHSDARGALSTRAGSVCGNLTFDCGSNHGAMSFG